MEYEIISLIHGYRRMVGKDKRTKQPSGDVYKLKIKIWTTTDCVHRCESVNTWPRYHRNGIHPARIWTKWECRLATLSLCDDCIPATNSLSYTTSWKMMSKNKRKDKRTREVSTRKRRSKKTEHVSCQEDRLNMERDISTINLSSAPSPGTILMSCVWGHNREKKQTTLISRAIGILLIFFRSLVFRHGIPSNSL